MLLLVQERVDTGGHMLRVPKLPSGDMTGRRFHRLLVKEFSHKTREACWVCSCDCGGVVVVRGSSLRNGNTKSCGCLQREISGKRSAVLWANRSPQEISDLETRKKQRAAERSQRWYKENKGRAVANARRSTLKRRDEDPDYEFKLGLKKYGLSLVQYWALFEAQAGLCAICRRPPAEDDRLVVDHDHGTHQVRGLLHRQCNVAIGLLKDDAALLDAAACYLRGKNA